MNKYEGSQYLHKHPRPGIVYLQRATDHPHRDKTKRRVTGKHCPLGRRLCAIGWCRGD
jgi:hypothetical protein